MISVADSVYTKSILFNNFELYHSSASSKLTFLYMRKFTRKKFLEKRSTSSSLWKIFKILKCVFSNFLLLFHSKKKIKEKIFSLNFCLGSWKKRISRFFLSSEKEFLFHWNSQIFFRFRPKKFKKYFFHFSINSFQLVFAKKKKFIVIFKKLWKFFPSKFTRLKKIRFERRNVKGLKLFTRTKHPVFSDSLKHYYSKYVNN